MSKRIRDLESELKTVDSRVSKLKTEIETCTAQALELLHKDTAQHLLSVTFRDEDCVNVKCFRFSIRLPLSPDLPKPLRFLYHTWPQHNVKNWEVPPMPTPVKGGVPVYETNPDEFGPVKAEELPCVDNDVWASYFVPFLGPPVTDTEIPAIVHDLVVVTWN